MCSGKTKLLEQLPNALNLEELAQHRGSLYGGVGLKPHRQKRFENLLLQELTRLNNEEYILIEGESRKIGDLHIPEFLYKAMKQGIHILITRSLDKRAEHAITEYFTSAKDIEEIKRITKSLFKVISKENQQKVLTFLETNQLHEAVKILLEYYYDILYQHTLKDISFSYTISHENEQQAITEIKTIISSFSSSSEPDTTVPIKLPHSSEP